MGAKQTKADGDYLPGTPVTTNSVQHSIKAIAYEKKEVHMGPEDPRSPAGSRTPLSTLCMPVRQHDGQMERLPEQRPDDASLGALHKRFFRGFSYNLNDPRSPTVQLNRTPLIFEEPHDRTLNLDDTFADLFVESRAPNALVLEENQMDIVTEKYVDLPLSTTHATDLMESRSITPYMNLNIASEKDDALPTTESTDFKEPRSITPYINVHELASFTCVEEETMLCPAILHQTPCIKRQLDPRSPTIGVERTPIMFDDDDNESGENVLLESILATLSLNISDNSNSITFDMNGAEAVISPAKSNEVTAELQKTKPVKRPANKHLDRVRIGKKHISRESIVRTRQHANENSENKSPLSYSVTPKSKLSGSSKRTPLSCVKNRVHLRSRSVEASTKSLNARLSLTSFDDNLNPEYNAKVANVHVMRSSDTFDF